MPGFCYNGRVRPRSSVGLEYAASIRLVVGSSPTGGTTVSLYEPAPCGVGFVRVWRVLLSCQGFLTVV